MKIQLIVIAVALAVGITSYIAYSKNLFGFKDKVNKAMGKKGDGTTTLEPVPLPEGALEGGTNIVDIEEPKAGSGAIPIHEAEKLQEYKPKPDETINTVFQQELYKQMFLPYDKYPYLYDQNYRQALVPPVSGFDNTNPAATVFGYRPPVQGGDVPPQDTDLNQYYAQLYNNYGMYPPGGGGTNYDYYYPSQVPYPYGLPPNYPYALPYGNDPLQWLDTVDQGQANNNAGNCQYPVPPSTHGNVSKCNSTYAGSCLVECQNPCSQTCVDCVQSCGPDAYNSSAMAKTMRRSYAALKYNQKLGEKDRLIFRKQMMRQLKAERRLNQGSFSERQIPPYTPPGKNWQKGYIADIARN